MVGVPPSRHRERSIDVLNLSLIGAGFIGRVHARCIAANPATRLAAVHDLDESAAADLAERHGARVAGSVDEIVSCGGTDAVVIASSTDSHGAIARACAAAGRPFLCEKPLDTGLAAALDTVRAVRDAGVFAGIGFNRRFDAQYAALKRAVDEGEIGRVETMHLTSRTHALPSLDYVKTSGGQLRDKGSHFFDLACWIAGERPVEIHIAGACLIEPRFADYGDVDTAMIIVRMESGALCHLDFSRRTAYGCDERIEVCGAEGRVESRHPIPVDVALYRGERHPPPGSAPALVRPDRGQLPGPARRLRRCPCGWRGRIPYAGRRPRLGGDCRSRDALDAGEPTGADCV